MSYPQYVTVMTPWGFFPVSDVYSVVPKWEEFHAVTADVIYDDDAPNYYALVCDLEATESSFTIAIRDTTDPDNPKPPATTATTQSYVWQLEGWNEEKPLVSTLVMDATVTPAVWTGDIKTVIPLPVRQWIGLHQIAKFVLDVILPTEPERPYRMAYGTVAVPPMTRISGALTTATGISISEGPGERDDLEIEVEGPKGEKGDKGDKGDPGPASTVPGPPGEEGPPGTSSGYYVHVQGTPAAVWTIDHDLIYQPAVTVIDSAGSQVEGDVQYIGNRVTVTFSAAFAGTAHLT